MASWALELPGDFAARYGIIPGGPVRLTKEPAQLLPACVSRGETVDSELHLFWPDGRQRPLHEALHWGARELATAHPPSVVLADGAFSVVTEEPAPEIVKLFALAGALTVAGDQDKQLLRFLASRFPRLRSVLDARTRFCPSSAAVALHLRADDWLQIRLFARVKPPDWRPGEPLPPDAVLFENRALDLWSIMNFVNPGYRGNRATFETRFDRPDAPPTRARCWPPSCVRSCCAAPNTRWLRSCRNASKSAATASSLRGSAACT